MASDPLTSFFEWISGAGAIREAGDIQSGGIRDASNTIGAAGDRAMGFLKPFLQGGTEDYGKLRDMTNTGYFNQAYPGSYQPPSAPTNTGYKPNWNPQTQSYESGRPSYQAPTMGMVKNMSLPQFKPTQPALQMQEPAKQQNTNTGFNVDGFKKMLMDMLNQGASIPPVKAPPLPESVMPTAPTTNDPTVNLGQPNLNPGSKPWTMTPQEMVNLLMKYKAGSGPMNPGAGKTTIPTFGGYR